MTNQSVTTLPQRNWGPRIQDLLLRDMRLIILENELLRVGVLAGKGTDIVELNYKPRDLDLAWLSAHGVQNPAALGSAYRDSLATFLDSYPGGWQEIFPNGGAPSVFDGAAYGQHDEVFALPWRVDIVEDTTESIAVRFTVRTHKVPCLIEKTMRLTSGVPQLRFEERLLNTGAVPVRAMWGHHITFGPPFLRPGCRIRLPDGVTGLPHETSIAPGGRRVANADHFAWPDATGEDGTSVDLSIIPERGTASEIVYISGFADHHGWYEIDDPDTRIGSRVEWDARQMPYLWYWQEFGATTGYPWYGRNYNIGLEPFSSYPTNGLAEAVANGSALTLEPGEARDFWLTMTILDPHDGGAA
ncbi:MAG TPA: DUF4432 family protein [Thermomicrobiales bacterium]|nr:DUF4432 family protein [Thermomicrobiales bacterium]